MSCDVDPHYPAHVWHGYNQASSDAAVAEYDACWSGLTPEQREEEEAHYWDDRAAGAALAAQLPAEEASASTGAAEGARFAADLEQEEVERPAREQADAERQPLAAEEDARLRAGFARQHPELAGYVNPAPVPIPLG